MALVSLFITVFVAFLHIYFLILEMFFWTKPLGLKVFAQSLDKAKSSAVLAANQGLYNGFLAAGLVWTFFIDNPIHASDTKVFFFGCITVAGIYGAWSVSRKILFIQAMPAVLGLILEIYLRNS